MRLAVAALLGLLLSTPALAAPGMGNEVYGAEIKSGEAEGELRYDALAGGLDDGEDLLQIGAAYGLNDHLRIGLQGEFEREPGAPRRAESLGIEAVYALGKLGGVDVAVYGEYEIGLNGPDAIEAKLILQHRNDPVDLRLSLIGEKALVAGAPVELSYALSADVAMAGDLRLGVQAFGELGTFNRPLPRASHFAGPVARIGIAGLGPEVEIEAGYLFALGAARDDTRGQLRIGLGLEF